MLTQIYYYNLCAWDRLIPKLKMGSDSTLVFHKSFLPYISLSLPLPHPLANSLFLHPINNMDTSISTTLSFFLEMVAGLYKTLCLLFPGSV